MLRSFDLDNQALDKIDLFGEYLSSIAWAMQCTYHPTLEAMPRQLVFGRDMTLDILFVAYWTKISP
eukprot:230277-Ditylum_brightwellii.AAC.1